MQEMPFERQEELYRAVRDWPRFYKRNGKLSDAALKDNRGLSVDRQHGRSRTECIAYMAQKFEGKVFMITYEQCVSVQAKVVCKPSNNPYHCEIHGDENRVALSNQQAFTLSEIGQFVCNNLSSYKT